MYHILKSNKVNIILLFFIVAIVFVTLFSYTTSPLYDNYGDTFDSLIFQIIGKYWSEGKLPYAELWDMKGPFIFFIDCLGYGLTGNRYGIYIIEIICLSITLFYIYRTLILYLNRRNSFLFSLLSLTGLSYIYEGGNLTEEYLLPFMAASFFLVVNWLKNIEECSDENIRHEAWYSVVYGLTIGISFLSRLTNALPIFSAFFVIVCILIKKAEYKNLLYNILGILFGFLLVIVPFTSYFYYNGLLIDMLEATIIYPFEYAIHSSNNIKNTGIHYFVLSYLNSIALLIISIIMFLNKTYTNNRYSKWLWLFVSGIPFIWFCQSNGFGHYGMIVFPLFAVIVIESRKMNYRIFPLLVFILFIIGFSSKLRFAVIMNQWKNERLTVYKAFLDKNENINYQSFVAYNCDPVLYLDLDICPASRFFAMQDFGIGRISKQQELIKDDFTKKNIEWILLNDNDKENVIIRDILSTKYRLISSDEVHHLKLYSLY